MYSICGISPRSEGLGSKNENRFFSRTPVHTQRFHRPSLLRVYKGHIQKELSNLLLSFNTVIFM